jgi:hypothetical protein
MYHTPSAILGVSSLDRYTRGNSKNVTRRDTALISIFIGNNTFQNYLPGAPGNNFELTSPSAFIYGYISRILISQIQIEYRVPTIVPSNSIFGTFPNNPSEPPQIGNDVLPIMYFPSNILPPVLYLLQLPYGFYTPQELAAMIEVQIVDRIPLLSQMEVTYSNSGNGISPTQPVQSGGIGFGNSFTFTTANGPITQLFAFPGLDELLNGFSLTPDEITAVLKTYRLFGITYQVTVNASFSNTNTWQLASPNFLYTTYIDIVSSNLTKFQKIKDTDTSVYGRTGLIARVFLSGVAYPQNTSATYGVGCEPFIMTSDLNTPKVIRWSPDEAIYNLDFQLYDQYGDALYWTNENPTEFQMTLLCQEDDK